MNALTPTLPGKQKTTGLECLPILLLEVPSRRREATRGSQSQTANEAQKGGLRKPHSLLLLLIIFCPFLQFGVLCTVPFSIPSLSLSLSVCILYLSLLLCRRDKYEKDLVLFWAETAIKGNAKHLGMYGKCGRYVTAIWGSDTIAVFITYTYIDFYNLISYKVLYSNDNYVAH